MYEEIVRRLRLAKAVLSRNKDLIALLSDAADAIEKAGIDWLYFSVKDGVGTKYINISNIVSLTEMEVDE